MKKKIAVLMGGFSVEREVSLSSGQGVLQAVQELGHEGIPIDVTRNIGELVENLSMHKPDVVLNLLHGRWGEDGCVQGLLEMMDIPYSHSGVSGSALAMNKVIARNLCEINGIRVPEGRVVPFSIACKEHVMEPPYVMKPIKEGSSIGVYLISDKKTPLPTQAEWPFEDEVLIERYIPGREIQVAVIGDRPIGAVELKFHNAFYDYDAKYTEGQATRLVPAPIHEEAYHQVLEWAAKAHKILECRGVSRSDFRYDDTKGEPGQLYFLEINSQPGFTPLSGVPIIAAHTGVPYTQLVQWMIEDALCRR